MKAGYTLNGLVLAGGFSRRMGMDKGLITADGTTMRERTFQLLATHCDSCWLSLRPDQIATSSPALPVLPDLHPGHGPLGALFTAFQFRRNCDWFVLPCDLPEMSALALSPLPALAAGLAGSADAVLFRDPSRTGPEPLTGIWCNSAGPVITDLFLQGERAVYPLLRLLRIREVVPEDLRVLYNQNGPGNWR